MAKEEWADTPEMEDSNSFGETLEPTDIKPDAEMAEGQYQAPEGETTETKNQGFGEDLTSFEE